MHPFRRLNVWRKAHELTIRVYAATEPMARRQHQGLASQLRRSAYSIPSNIAEGAGQSSAAQFGRFLQMAIASAREMDYFLLLAADIDALSRSDHAILEARADEVARMLVSLHKTVVQRANSAKAPRPKAATGKAESGDPKSKRSKAEATSS